VLVSGGDDTLAHAWAMAEVLDMAGDWSPHARVAPLHVWWAAPRRLGPQPACRSRWRTMPAAPARLGAARQPVPSHAHMRTH
jgi:hypothetical protein